MWAYLQGILTKVSCNSLAKIRQITLLQQQKYTSKPSNRPTTKKKKKIAKEHPQRPANSAPLMTEMMHYLVVKQGEKH